MSDIKPSELKARWPIYLIIISVALAVLNGGICAWKIKNPPIATPATKPDRVEPPPNKDVQPPAEDVPDPKWGVPSKQKLVPGRGQR